MHGRLQPSHRRVWAAGLMKHRILHQVQDVYRVVYMSYSLHSVKGGYTGDYDGDYYRACKGIVGV